MARRKRKGEISILNNVSFLDVWANAVGALAFILLLVVIFAGMIVIMGGTHWFDLKFQTPERLPDATVGEAYRCALSVTGGNEAEDSDKIYGRYYWSLKKNRLPKELEGLEFDPLGGKIFGTPQKATSKPISFEVKVDDDPLFNNAGKITGNKPAITKRFSLLVHKKRIHSLEIPPLKIETDSLPDGTKGKDYKWSLIASGGVKPYSWSVSRELLPDLRFDSTAGTLKGVLRRTGESRFTVTVKESAGTTAQTEFSLNVKSELKIHQLKITTGRNLPTAQVNEPYTLTLAAIGGVPPYTWSSDGKLPSGLQLNPETGLISGFAEKAGKFKFSVEVEDTGEPPFKVKKKFSLKVNPPPHGKKEYEAEIHSLRKELDIARDSIRASHSTKRGEVGKRLVYLILLLLLFPVYHWIKSAFLKAQQREVDRILLRYNCTLIWDPEKRQHSIVPKTGQANVSLASAAINKVVQECNRKIVIVRILAVVIGIVLIWLIVKG